LAIGTGVGLGATTGAAFFGAGKAPKLNEKGSFLAAAGAAFLATGTGAGVGSGATTTGAAFFGAGLAPKLNEKGSFFATGAF
jgi:hypothetical protein